MTDWTSTAVIFPGQGSQVVGMGADFAQRYDIARDTFAIADEILGFDLVANLLARSRRRAESDHLHSTGAVRQQRGHLARPVEPAASRTTSLGCRA